MKKKLNYIYTLVLTLLMFLSMYQTGRLWFDDLSDYNPFSSYINNYASQIQLVESYKSSNYNMTKPQDIIIYLSKEELFAKLSNTQSDSKTIYDQSLVILKEFVKSKSVKVEELDYNKFWDKVQGSIVLTYNYTITNDIFNKEIDYDNSINIDSIGGIDLIVIDIINTSTKANIYLANTIENKMYTVSVEVGDSFDKLYTINNEEGKKQTLYDYIDTNAKIEFDYVSSKNKEQFSGNIFLREQSKEFLVFDEVGINKSFIDNGKIMHEDYDDYVRKYFNNPNIVQMAEQGDGENFYYWDNKMSINYNKNGILEYTQPSSSNGILDVNKAYYIATTFIDNYLIKWEEVYLADYKIDKANNIIRFYFNYRLYDYPLIIEELNEYDMNYPIEVEINGDKVKNAKIYLIEQDLKIIPERISINDNYIRVLDEVYDGKPIKNLYIAYRLPKSETTASLKWVIEENEKSYYDVLWD